MSIESRSHPDGKLARDDDRSIDGRDPVERHTPVCGFV
jgi:hypothetical protein